MSRLKGARLENEIEKCRAEANWNRIKELLPQISSKGSGLENLANFLYGEWALESFIESAGDPNGGFPKPDPGNREPLKKAESYLVRVFESSDIKPSVAIESHLLLSKIHYLAANFDQTINSVNKARLDRDSMQFQTLRTLRLVSEAYAIKGLSLEQKLPLSGANRQQRMGFEEQILNCFEKAADLALALVGELEKTAHSAVGAAGTPMPVTPGFTGRSERIGELMETAIQRVPLMYIRQGQILGDMTNSGNLKNKSLEQSVEQYRKVLTVTDKPVAQHLHQKLSRQLAELLLRGVPDGVYVSPSQSEAAGNKAQSLSFYIGKNKAYCPSSRLEEILLILSISESIAAREAVLSRAEEDEKARELSHLNVKAVQNLLTLVLSSLRQYQLLAGILEKAMKFAFQDRFIWFQFALSLMCFGRNTRSALVLKECVRNIPETEADPAAFMFAAKLSIECLGQYDQGIDYAQKAIKLSQGGWLTGRAHILLGLGYSLKSQTAATFDERKRLQREAIGVYEDAIRCDPKDHLAVFFLALQQAIGRDVVEAKKLCQKSLDMQMEQPAAFMLLALLLTAENEIHEALEVVLEAMAEFPSYYGLLVLRLKLEMALGRPEEALVTAKDLLLFWKHNQSAQYPATSVSPAFSGGIDTKAVTPMIPPSVAGMRKSESAAQGMDRGSQVGLTATLLMGHPSTMGLAPSPSAVDVTDKGSVMGGTGGAMSEYGGAASTISDSLGVRTASSFQRSLHQQWRIQANIWLELAELFLEHGRLEYVSQCVDEACSMFPNSHQTLYLKGRLAEIRLKDFEQSESVLCAGKLNDSELAQKADWVKNKLIGEAKGCFLGALAIFPNHIPTLRHLAVVYEIEGNLRMAEKVLRDLVKIEPMDHLSWQGLGQVMAEEGRQEEAAQCFMTGTALEGCAPIMPFLVIPRVIHL